MTDRARKLLDNLLGVNRNSIINKNNADYCIYFIAGGCPYEILKNTKLSLGNCRYKIHESRDSINKILYEQELIKILADFLSDVDKKIQECSQIKDENIMNEEYRIDLKLSKIEENITEENVVETYNKFQKLEYEIYNLEKIKETFFVKNKEQGLEKCRICGMSIIKNFCSRKYVSHVEGKAHRGVKQLRKLYIDLKNKGI